MSTAIAGAAFNPCPSRQRSSASPAAAAASYPTGAPLALYSRRPPTSKRICCEVAVTTAEVSSSSAPASSASDAELEASSRIGARVRVTAPVKVYHVPKVPELDLNGMEGQIKDYVGLWKGKRISANLPFKVAFVLPDGVEGRPGPLKFFAHLREDEFEYLPQA